MQITKSIEVTLKDKTIIDVMLFIETADGNYSYEYDDAGLNEQQMCEAESIIESNCDAWVDLILSGEDVD